MSNDKTFSLEGLIEMLPGESVTITHTGNSTLKDSSGVCKTVHTTENGFDVELTNGGRWGIVPDTLTRDSIEGNIGKFVAGRRKIQIVSSEEHNIPTEPTFPPRTGVMGRNRDQIL